MAKTILDKEPNLVDVEGPVNICGDLKGHFSSLETVFALAGDVPDSNYIFLGNYVNYGRFSAEVMLLLLAIKCRYPSRIILLRGKQECAVMT